MAWVRSMPGGIIAAIENWLRLKNVWGDIIEVKKDVHTRVYDRGIVVLNGTDQAQKIQLPLLSPGLQKAESIIDIRVEKAYLVKAAARALAP